MSEINKFSHLIHSIYYCLLCCILSCSSNSDPVKFNLITKVSPIEAGSIHPVSGTFESGETVQITIAPTLYYEFSNWLEYPNNSSSDLEVIMDNDKAVTAVFVKKDDDKDGVPNDKDSCPNTQQNEMVDENGCSDMQKDSDGDGVWDAIDLCPSTADGKMVNINGCALYQIDNDKDGVPDNVDLCLNTPMDESVNLYGCSFTQVMFNPKLSYGQISDIDGNTYKTIQIGSQIWMAENLRTTRYNDGSAIKILTARINSKQTTGACILFELNEENLLPFGRHYNYFSVFNSSKICPNNWHVPNKDEWIILINHLGGEHEAALKLSERGENHWGRIQNVGGTLNYGNNESGFTAIPAGLYGNTFDEFYGSGEFTSFWFIDKNTSNSGYYSIHYGDLSNISFSISNDDNVYRCIRCIKD